MLRLKVIVPIIGILCFARAETKSFNRERFEDHILRKRLTQQENQCKINVKIELHNERTPIIVSFEKPELVPEFVYPTIEDPTSVKISSDKGISIFCAGKTNRKSTEVSEAGVLVINKKVTNPVSSLESMECNEKGLFDIIGMEIRDIKLNDVSCQEKNSKQVEVAKYSHDAILRQVVKKCGTGKVYEIGFDLGKKGFLKTIDLCHDEKQHRTLWAHSTVIPVNQQKYRFTGGTRKSFKPGSLYDGMQMTTNSPYETAKQYKTVQALFDGDESKASQYISTTIRHKKFLARGHLIANADKFYKYEQDSTYFYANVVPMWQQINAVPGNWFFIEEYVRHLSYHKNTELDVWAGGVGTMKLENKNDYASKNLKEKYFQLDGKIPVPQVIFKCVIDKKNEEGLCFLVVNNPYLGLSQVENSKDKYIICKKYDLCEKVNPNFDSMINGYFYCCKVNDFYNNHHKTLGLKDLEEFQNYKELTLVTNDKHFKIIK